MVTTENKVVIVTGAASGIGRAAALLFAERGYHVVGVDRDAEGLSKLAADESVAAPDGAGPRGEIAVLAGDVATDQTNEAAVKLAVDRFGRLDAAVLNAGIGGAGPLESDGALDRFDRILAVNVRGVASGVRAAVPALRAVGGGAIVATSSVSGLRGDPATWAYNASKAAVVNLVRGLALDYAVENIRINAIAPGGALTAMTAAQVAHPTFGPLIASRIPQQRWSDPREQAEAIWFLASPAASYINGVTIPVDGGLSANGGILLPPAFPGDAPH
ncbi:MAG TPA: SDR family oxidoreductase [Actinocrinis sp.]|nr:SDR family oxidoreductase [Actinocrinis sp.]